uniref:RRP15-like protein n=1 Tax=Ascaris lumbricoides TaxID=6252 RepID=A0A0M3HJN7_ASCLU
MASKKKKGLNKKNDDWDDEAAGKKLAQLKLESASDNEESTDDEDVVPARKGNIAFNMLAAVGFFPYRLFLLLQLALLDPLVNPEKLEDS